MKLIRNSFAAGIAFATLAVAACSTQQGSSTGGAPGTNGNTDPGAGILSQGGLGQVHMNLDIPGGTSISTFSWTISNGTNTYTGTDPIGDAQSAEFVAGGILAGSGYVVKITGTDSNLDPCSGSSAAFTVTAGGVTQVVLGVVCVVPPDGSTAANVPNGSVEVDAAFSLMNTGAVACPGISSFSISPAEINLSQTATLTLSTVGPNALVTWSALPTTGGTFGNSSSANTTFQCANVPAAGSQVTVTATIALTDSGLCSGKQFTTMSALINCESGALICPTGTTVCGPDGGAQACANLQTDLNNCGTCGNICPTAPAGSSEACVSGSCQTTVKAPTLPCTQLVGGVPADSTGSTSCVQCTNNNSLVCTPTEALIVAQDIAAKKTVTGGQLDPNASCYVCLANAGGLDDSQGDTGNECSDVATTQPTLTGESANQACLDVVSCIISSGCDTASPPALCLCGTAAGTACLTAGAANGACLQQEINGLDIGTGTVFGSLVEGDPTATQKAFTNKATPAGAANVLGAFAFSNCAPQCGANL